MKEDGTGTVNFTAAEAGSGVYFLNCCSNSNDAYYKFTGAAIGNIFQCQPGAGFVLSAIAIQLCATGGQRCGNSQYYAFDVSGMATGVICSIS